MKNIYLAYGSNLNLEQMGQRCPDAAVIGTTVLTGHRLVFRGGRNNGVATIEAHRGSAVPVLLWEITKRCEQALDRYEGYPNLYRKEQLTVNLDGQDVQAMAYVMNEGPPPAKPGAWYYATILHGYRDCGFDDAILKEAVKRTMESVQ